MSEIDVEIYGPYCIYQADSKPAGQSQPVFQFPNETELKPKSTVQNNLVSHLVFRSLNTDPIIEHCVLTTYLILSK